jgi:hypothetical protein
MDAMHLLKRDESVGLIIDVQERLHGVIDDAERVARKVGVLARGLRVLGVPLLVTEQYPKGVGPTLAEVKAAAGEATLIEKREFGCFGSALFRETMEPYADKTLILCGYETHVCVLQTALQARGRGHRVFVVADAAGSREPENKRMALERLREAGCTVTTVEMTLFELLGSADSPEFKAIQALIK